MVKRYKTLEAYDVWNPRQGYEPEWVLASDYDALKKWVNDSIPLIEEARDALTAIPLASAKLRGIDLSLARRMDERFTNINAQIASALETNCAHVWVDSPDVSDKHCVRCGVAPGEDHASADHDFESDRRDVK